jgi:hypothetical protein
MIWMKTDDVWIGTLSIGYRTDEVGPSKASSRVSNGSNDSSRDSLGDRRDTGEVALDSREILQQRGLGFRYLR